MTESTLNTNFVKNPFLVADTANFYLILKGTCEYNRARAGENERERESEREKKSVCERKSER